MKYGYKKAKQDFQGRYCVRALRAADLNVRRAAVLAEVDRTYFYDLMKWGRINPRKVSPREVYRVKPYRVEFEDFSRRFLIRALARSPSVSAAARFLGVDRTHVYRMATRFGVGSLRRSQEVTKPDEGNAAWLALADGEPAPHKADAHGA